MESDNEQIIAKSICPARKALNVLKGKFTLEILSEIIDGNLHYGSLLRRLVYCHEKFYQPIPLR